MYQLTLVQWKQTQNCKGNESSLDLGCHDYGRKGKATHLELGTCKLRCWGSALKLVKLPRRGMYNRKGLVVGSAAKGFTNASQPKFGSCRSNRQPKHEDADFSFPGLQDTFQVEW